MIKFRSALIFSIVFHISLFALVLYVPHSETGNETTYYVDLIHLNGGPGGTGSGISGGQDRAESGTSGDTTATVMEDASGSIKDLTVKKEAKSSLRYPDKKGKQREEKKELVSVVRKSNISVKRKTDSNISTTGKGTSRELSTGISSGEPGPGGTGTGFGQGGVSFPYAYYIDIFRSKISAAWYDSLVSPGLRGKYVTIVRFRIVRSGGIEELQIEKKSGITSLDLSALRAIENAAPFAPLPPDFPGSYLIVHFKFEWEK